MYGFSPYTKCYYYLCLCVVCGQSLNLNCVVLLSLKLIGVSDECELNLRGWAKGKSARLSGRYANYLKCTCHNLCDYASISVLLSKHNTVKPVLVATCIKQPPPYCGHFLWS